MHSSLDISPEDVDKVIQCINKTDRPAKQAPESELLSSFYLDAVVDLDKAIKMAQQRVWKALKVESKFDISTEETHEILAKYSKSKVMLVILNIDLVGSTRLSSDLPTDRLAHNPSVHTGNVDHNISVWRLCVEICGRCHHGFFPCKQ